MFLNIYRQLRVRLKQISLIEPYIPLKIHPTLEFHGNSYCGWFIPENCLHEDSVVVDIGLGEDISFSQSIIDRYGCVVHGFDPTPRSIAFVKALACDKLVVHEYGVAAVAGSATFYLPNEESHVSGSLTKEEHVGRETIEVQLLRLRDVFSTVRADRIDLLKLDIEGAEYDLIASKDFNDLANRISILCIEFHHRWKAFGKNSTYQAIETLGSLGFICAWRSSTTNNEFLFVKTLE